MKRVRLIVLGCVLSLCALGIALGSTKPPSAAAEAYLNGCSVIQPCVETPTPNPGAGPPTATPVVH